MEMRNYLIPKEIINRILKYKKIKKFLFENIQINKEFIRHCNKNKQKNKEKNNTIDLNENLFISKGKLDHNLIHSFKNNFIQNPEYSFFKIKRESFRKENILLSMKILEIEINQNEIYIDEKNIKGGNESS